MFFFLNYQIIPFKCEYCVLIRSSAWKTDIPEEADSKFVSKKFDKEGQLELYQM